MSRWSDLSPRNKSLIATSAVVDLVLKAVALKDLAGRPSDEIRGPKWAWALGSWRMASRSSIPATCCLNLDSSFPTRRG